MKKLIQLVSILCIVCLIGGCALVTDVDDGKKTSTEKTETVVTIDGKDISVDRFNLYFYDAQDEYLKNAGYSNTADIPKDFWGKKVDGKKTNLEIVKENALADLIDDTIIYNEAIKRKVELPNEEKSYMTDQISQLKQDKVSLAQFENMGISIDEFEDYYIESAYNYYLLQELKEKEEIVVKDEDISKTFEEEFVKAKHILISIVDQQTQQLLSEKAIKEAEEKANNILKQIKAGADFDELMNSEGQDPGVASSPSGYVFTEGEMVKPFEKAAFALKIGEVSDLVKTDFGFHIIKRVAFDPEGEAELQAHEKAENIAAEKELKKLVKVWKSKAEIKINNKVLKNIKPTINKNEE